MNNSNSDLQQQAQRLLNNAYYCHKYNIKMASRKACLTWANSPLLIGGSVLTRTECLQCPNYHHLLNLKEYKRDAEASITNREQMQGFFAVTGFAATQPEH